MQKVSKGILKAKMLQYFRQVEQTGEPLIVTDHGKEVLEIRPLQAPRATADDVKRIFRESMSDAPAPAHEDMLASAWSPADDADDSWWTAKTTHQ